MKTLRWSLILRRLTLSALTLLLSSCATFRSEPVAEIVPLLITTSVRVKLNPGFTIRCRYTDKPCVVQSLQMRLVDDDLRVLHDQKESLLADSRRLLSESRNCADAIAQEWLQALDCMNGDMESAWRSASDDAYRQIVDRVLTTKQRERYYKYERRGLSREDIWAKLAPSPSQRERIVAMYRDALVRTQPIWLVSGVFADATHHRLDAILPEMSKFLAESELVGKSIEALREQIGGAERKHQDAEREVTWIQAQLQVEKDAAVQIRLRKAVADKRAEAEQLRIAAPSLQREMSGYTWNIPDLAGARESMAKRYAANKAVHDAHVRLLQAIWGMRGNNAAGMDATYGDCLRELTAAVRLVLRNDAGFPESLVSRAARGIRRIE